MTVIGLVAAPGLLRLLNVPDDIFAYSLTYLRIYLTGLVPTMIYNTGAGILRAVGDSKRPLYFLIVSCIANIVLDILFVAVLPFGIAGAAVATVISQIASCLLTLRVLSHTEECYRYELRDLTFDGPVLAQIIRIGLPTGIQSALYSVANLFIQASVNGFGTDTVAAYTAFGKIDAMKRITHPSEVVSVGDIVKVYVYGIDEGKGRVQLSLLPVSDIEARDRAWKENRKNRHAGIHQDGLSPAEFLEQLMGKIQLLKGAEIPGIDAVKGKALLFPVIHDRDRRAYRYHRVEPYPGNALGEGQVSLDLPALHRILYPDYPQGAVCQGRLAADPA